MAQERARSGLQGGDRLGAAAAERPPCQPLPGQDPHAGQGGRHSAFTQAQKLFASVSTELWPCLGDTHVSKSQALTILFPHYNRGSRLCKRTQPASLGISDVSECWPSCPPQFSGTELEKSYMTAICPAGYVVEPKTETAEHATPLPAAGDPGQPRKGRKERGVRKEVHLRPVPEPVPLAVMAVGLPLFCRLFELNPPTSYYYY